VPIFASLGLTSIIGGLLTKLPIPPVALISEAFKGITIYSLIALPLYMFMGTLMTRVGITERLMDLSDMLVGWIRGGLAHVTIVGEMFLSGITGTAVGDCAALGATVIPMMKKRGFSPEFSATITAVSSLMGPLIPPSLNMIVLGGMLGISVGGLFAAGIIPGILIGLIDMVVTYFLCRKMNIQLSPFPKLGQLLRATIKATPALTAIFIILGGILGGVFTPTEAGAIAVVYSLILGLAYRTLNWKIIMESLVECAELTSIVLIILGFALFLSRILLYLQLPQKIIGVIANVSTNKYVIISIMMIFFLLVGMFMDMFANMIILGPLAFPIFESLGMDPIHFGVVFIFVLLIGQFTPPYALCLFITCPMAGVSVDKTIPTLLPFFVGSLIALVMLIAFPAITLFVPRLLGFG
jgi:C4-dicarboxylate transporter DctM subunit